MAYHENRRHDPLFPIAVNPCQDIVFPAHWHEDIELVVLLEGEMDFFIDGVKHHLKAGDGALAAPRAIHAYDGVGSRGIIFIFPPLAALPSGVAETTIPPLRNAVIRAGASALSIAEIACAGAAAARSTAPGKALVVTGAAALLRGLFADAAATARTTAAAGTGNAAATSTVHAAGGEARIRRALAYLEERFAGKVSMVDAARAAGISSCYFSRLFPRLTGLRFVDWLVSRRLAEAERLLSSSDLSISEIAEESGFGGIRSMDRAFKSRRAINPREFRRRMAGA